MDDKLKKRLLIALVNFFATIIVCAVVTIAVLEIIAEIHKYLGGGK